MKTNKAVYDTKFFVETYYSKTKDKSQLTKTKAHKPEKDTYQQH